MAKARKSYHQYCGLARALDVVGERWTLLVARNLLLGPRRYSDLLAELPGITTNLLAKRLADMEALGLVDKERRAPPLAATVYRLTETGRALEPAIMELARWGGRWLRGPTAKDRVDIGWGLLSLKRRYRGGLDLVAELTIDERRFVLGLEPSYLRVEERATERADLRVSGSLRAFRRWLFEDGPTDALAVEGDAGRWPALRDAFPPAPPPSARGSSRAPG